MPQRIWAITRSGGLVPVTVIYVLLAVAVTWPLCRVLSTRLAGDETDPWQSVWAFWWLRHYKDFNSSPFFTKLLWWPHGAPLWFQSWDIPSAWLQVFASPALSEITAYNLAILASYIVSGLTFYWLACVMFESKWPACFGGCLYSFSLFHHGAASANLHIASMQWSPVAFVGLVYIMRGRTLWGGVVGGIGLSLAGLASIYHAVFCVAASAIVLAWSYRSELRKPDVVKGLAVASAVTGILLGWLVLGMYRQLDAATYVGAHDPRLFSIDLMNLLTPSGVSAWAPARASAQVTERMWVESVYLGLVFIALALGGCLQVPKVRGFGVLALVGVALTLGPYLRIGEHALSIPMPYNALVTLVPPLGFSGLPSRWCWLTVFGGAVCAAGGLSALWRSGRLKRLCAVAFTAAAVLESWPATLPMHRWPAPSILSAWARDGGDWAVMDMTYPPRALWHQMQHRHPIVGGYLTRTPKSLVDEVRADKILYAFMEPGRSVSPLVLTSPSLVRSHLKALRIRFLIADAGHVSAPRQAGLDEVGREEDLVFFAVR